MEQNTILMNNNINRHNNNNNHIINNLLDFVEGNVKLVDEGKL